MLLALPAGAGLAGDRPLRRQGDFWVQTETGAEAVPRRTGLRVRASGRVSVKGTAEEKLRYVLTKRVRAGSEAEARRRLDAFHPAVTREGSVLVIAARSERISADLDIVAPRGMPEVVVLTNGGAVEASDLEGSLRTETGGGQVVLDRIGGSVTARTAGGDIVLGAIGGSVRCTSGGGPIRAAVVAGEAWFETAGGDITVARVDGPVRCTTAGGGIRIETAGATVLADTMGGPIEVVSARGLVTARNSGGPIELGAARGGAQCESAGGTIRVSNISGGLRASTARGNIVAYVLADEPLSDSFLTTGSGDITLRLPSSLRATIRARNESTPGSRRIVSEFADIVIGPAGYALAAEGALNGGGPLVRLATGNGTIYILRRDK